MDSIAAQSGKQNIVSIVIPCYNKVNFIENTFTSVCAQIWRNIELILVNDGSNDGTREVIENWVPIFNSCGITTIVIDQENQGLPAAVLVGLKHVTGKYICQINADDTITPDYVSCMAEYMEEHDECQYTVCDYIMEDAAPIKIPYFSYVTKLSLYGYVLRVCNVAPNMVLIRKEYFDKCNILEKFYTGREATQEPQIMLPLMYFGGKYKYFEKALYKHNASKENNRLSGTYNADQTIYFCRGYLSGIFETLKNLPIEEERRKTLMSLAEIVEGTNIINRLLQFPYNEVFEHIYSTYKTMEDELRKLAGNTRMKLNFAGVIKHPIMLRQILMYYYLGIETTAQLDITKFSRLIVCGCLGKNAKRILPDLLNNTGKPYLLWDEKATGDSKFNDFPITMPDYANLNKGDIVFVLVSETNAATEIQESLIYSECGHIMSFTEINVFLGKIKYFSELCNIFESKDVLEAERG